METISIKDMLLVMRKWLWLLVLIPVIAGAATGVYAYAFMEDVYTAKTSLYVLDHYYGAIGNIQFDTVASNEFALDYREMFDRSPVLSQTQAKLNLRPLAEVAHISVGSVDDRIVQISATGTDPVRCATIVNTVAALYREYLKEFIRIDNVSITETATIPQTPTGPSRPLRVLLVAFSSFLVAFGAVLLITLLDRRISTREQVESQLRVPYLGGVYDCRKEMQALCAQGALPGQTLYAQVDSFLREGVQAAATNISFAQMDQQRKALLIASANPGEDTGAMTALLAGAYAQQGLRTLVVDMDAADNPLRRFLGMPACPHDLVDCLAEGIPLATAACETPLAQVFYLGNRHAPQDISKAMQHPAMDALLGAMKDAFDMILFTSPPLMFFADPIVLASRLDGSVLVLAQHSLRAEQVEQAISQLTVGGKPVLGVILDGLKRPDKNQYLYLRRYEKEDKRRMEQV